MREVGDLARGHSLDGPGDRRDPVRGRAATTADDVQPAVAGELAEHLGRVVPVSQEAAEAVGHAGVGVATDPGPADRGQALDRVAHLFDPDRTVQTHAQSVAVRDRIIKRLDRLGRERTVVVEDRSRDHHGQSRAGLFEELVNGKQAGFQHERVKRGLRQEQVDARLDQGLDLRLVVGHHLIEGHVAAARVLDVNSHRELLLGRPDAAGHEPGLIRIPAGVVVGGPSRQLGGRPVQLVDVLLETELLQSDRRGVEGVGLNDIGAGLQVGPVDLLDHPRLGCHQHLGAVLQMVIVAGEPAAAHVFLGQLVGVDQSPHRSVKDHDSAGQDLLKP